MSLNTSISLDDHFAAFIQKQVASGRYKSVSETVRAGLRLLEDHELRVEYLREALAQGESSGEPTEFDFSAFIDSKKQ